MEGYGKSMSLLVGPDLYLFLFEYVKKKLATVFIFVEVNNNVCTIIIWC